MATQEKNVKEEKKETIIPEGASLEWEPRAFKAFGKTTRINSRDLAIMIREQFQKTFHDLKGCAVEFQNGFVVSLYFEYNALEVPEGKIRNLVNLTTGQGVNPNNLYEAAQFVNRKFSGVTYELNTETKELLSDFMFGGKQHNNPKDKGRWNKYVTERHVPASNNMWQPNSEIVMVQVTGLDIRVICKKLFGSEMITETITKDNEVINKKSEAFYEVRYSRHLPDNTFMINIEQFDRDGVNDLIKRETPQVVTNNFGFVMY